MRKGAPRNTVLLVDDEVMIVELYERLLKSRYDVVTATSGSDALQILKERPIDVIITDQRMPGMSGVQLLEKSLAINPKIVKIILSAHTNTADILSAINVCRINHYLVKPVDNDVLLEVVAKALALVPESARYD